MTEWECLEVIYAYKQFWVYFHGVKLKVVTDHASLRWLQNLQEPEGRLTQWALKLQAYDFEIMHQPGAKHQNVDYLSQLPTVAITADVADIMYKKMIVGKYQDEPLPVIKVLDGLRQDTFLRNGELYKRIGESTLSFPKHSARPVIIMDAHKAVGHGGLKKML